MGENGERSSAEREGAAYLRACVPGAREPCMECCLEPSSGKCLGLRACWGRKGGSCRSLAGQQVGHIGGIWHGTMCTTEGCKLQLQDTVQHSTPRRQGYKVPQCAGGTLHGRTRYTVPRKVTRNVIHPW